MTDIDQPMLDPRYPIETERLSLRRFRANDLEVLHRLQSVPEVAHRQTVRLKPTC